MKIRDWNKISDNKKKVLSKQRPIFISGSRELSPKRVNELMKRFGKGSNVVFGCLKNEYIEGFEGGLQYKSLNITVLEKALDRFSDKKVSILNYFQKDLKYIIRELKPIRVIFINGSWKGQIHYRGEYWEAVDCKAQIELMSPFSSEEEAKEYAREVEKKYDKIEIYNKNIKYYDKEIFEILDERRLQSWDWIGQPTAALVKNGKILAIAHNRVVPYQAFQMHEGALRERLKTPAQEMLETQHTNHSEIELMEEARRKKLSLKDVSIYTTIFPCPVCAKMISRTPIKKVVYSFDHNPENSIGYKVLEMSGVRLERVVV